MIGQVRRKIHLDNLLSVGKTGRYVRAGQDWQIIKIMNRELDFTEDVLK